MQQSMSEEPTLEIPKRLKNYRNVYYQKKTTLFGVVFFVVKFFNPKKDICNL